MNKTQSSKIQSSFIIMLSILNVSNMQAPTTPINPASAAANEPFESSKIESSNPTIRAPDYAPASAASAVVNEPFANDVTRANTAEYPSRRVTQAAEDPISALNLPLMNICGPIEWEVVPSTLSATHIRLKNSLMIRPGHADPNKLHICSLRKEGKKIEGIVLSCVSGNTAHNISTFLAGDVSVHYYISHDGTIIQLVPETHMAWSVGISARSNILNHLGGTPYNLSCNSETVSIWLEARNLAAGDSRLSSVTQEQKFDTEVLSSEQCHALNKLVTQLAEKYHVNPLNIFTYADCAIDKATGAPLRLHPNNWPGPFIPWNQLDAALKITPEDMKAFVDKIEATNTKPWACDISKLKQHPSLTDAPEEILKQIVFLQMCEKLGYFIPKTTYPIASDTTDQAAADDQSENVPLPDLKFFEKHLLRFKFRWYHMHMDYMQRQANFTDDDLVMAYAVCHVNNLLQ